MKNLITYIPVAILAIGILGFQYQGSFLSKIMGAEFFFWVMAGGVVLMYFWLVRLIDKNKKRAEILKDYADTLFAFGKYREERRIAIKNDEMGTLMGALSRAFTLVEFRQGVKPDNEELAFLGKNSDTSVGKIDREKAHEDYMNKFKDLKQRFDKIV